MVENWKFCTKNFIWNEPVCHMILREKKERKNEQTAKNKQNYELVAVKLLKCNTLWLNRHSAFERIYSIKWCASNWREGNIHQHQLQSLRIWIAQNSVLTHMHKWYNIRFEFVVTIAPGGSVGGVDFLFIHCCWKQ